jgi:hypothetical protein
LISLFGSGCSTVTVTSTSLFDESLATHFSFSLSFRR